MSAEAALVAWILIGVLFLGAGAAVELWGRVSRRRHDQDRDWYEDGQIRW